VSSKDVVVESRSRHIGKVIFVKDGLPVVACKEGLIQLVDIRDDESSPVFVNFRSKFN
jgi:methionyl-tRNA formyltransferase